MTSKSKFAGLAQARLQAVEQESQPAAKPAVKKTRKPARKKAVKQASNTAVKQAGNTVGITIRVDEALRHHWNVQAAIERTTLTDEIIKCLTKRFGTPKPK